MRSGHDRLTASVILAILSSMFAMCVAPGVAAQAPAPPSAQSVEHAMRDTLRTALSFLASFDHGFRADYAHGDPVLYVAPTRLNLGEAMVETGDSNITIAKGQGRYGDAIQFRTKNTKFVFYRAAVNLGYRQHDWSGTISFWLSLTPDIDLEPGYTDPIQITDKTYNNAAIWVDFTRDDKPRHFRLGVFGDSAAWNRRNLPSEQDPFFNQRTIVVTRPPFVHGRWTHVAIVFSKLNTDSGGTAKLYLNGRLQGTAAGIKEPFTWEPALSTIRLGTNYVGLLDELSVYDRALSDAAIDALYHLPGGVGTLLK